MILVELVKLTFEKTSAVSGIHTSLSLHDDHPPGTEENERSEQPGYTSRLGPA
jgi:hypothetical protein